MSRKSKQNKLYPVCDREKFTLLEAQKEDIKRNPDAKSPATYCCQRCGKWHVLPRWSTNDELVTTILSEQGAGMSQTKEKG